MQDEAFTWRQWSQGAAATFPIAVAAIPIGLVCGALAAERGDDERAGRRGKQRPHSARVAHWRGAWQSKRCNAAPSASQWLSMTAGPVRLIGSAIVTW